ncbi:hypothetical protein ABTX34_03040 [Streptomyces sp. NPDC096538]|uniref:hypothetical protein n=1 Tax=Streptomyces sp. NPDC096538 TaxID=3155427 RepID=UPI0033333A9E
MSVGSLMDMPDVWIGLTATERRRNWWWTGFLTLVFAGWAVAAGLAQPASERWWWVGGTGVLWSASVLYMINRGYGRTCLTEDGMQFRTFVSRRAIPWSEITRIEKRRHSTRGGAWWDLRAVRRRGRALTIPGVFTHRMWDAEFDRKWAVIQERWSRANGD